MQTAVRAEVELFLGRVSHLRKKNTPSIRQLRRELSKRLEALPAKAVLAAAQMLIARNYRWVGYELVHHHAETMKGLRLVDVESLGNGMSAWEHVDTFACYVSGPSWREQRISDRAVRRWTKSPDRWWRRAALVSTVPLNVKAQGGLGDVQRTLDICGRLVNDHDDMVEKAESWALRCLVQHDPGAVREFLKEHGEDLGARVKREVMNKLQTGLKNPQRMRSTRLP